MKISETLRTRIVAGMRDAGLNQTQIAKAMGYEKPWATRLLNGTMKTLSDDQVERLEQILGIEFFRFSKTGKEVSGLGLMVSEATKDNPDLAQAVEAVCRLADRPAFTPPYIETSDMTLIGQEIIRLVFANEDKAGKVAREVLKLLNDYPKRKK